jgi:hypothetical protein
MQNCVGGVVGGVHTGVVLNLLGADDGGSRQAG